ncbi:MAG: hypothetical protein NZM30_07505 [Geminocystis sp.]|nr:hypothetical protein [Geminocystis sp.]
MWHHIANGSTTCHLLRGGFFAPFPEIKPKHVVPQWEAELV